jgi:hypothetical protein
MLLSEWETFQMRVFWEPEWRSFFFCMSKVRPEYHTNKQTSMHLRIRGQSITPVLYCTASGHGMAAWIFSSPHGPYHTLEQSRRREEAKPVSQSSKIGPRLRPPAGLSASLLAAYVASCRTCSVPSLAVVADTSAGHQAAYQAKHAAATTPALCVTLISRGGQGLFDWFEPTSILSPKKKSLLAFSMPPIFGHYQKKLCHVKPF